LEDEMKIIKMTEGAEASQTTRDAYPIVSDDEWAEALLNLN
jgi:hypothetical protein